MTVKERPITCSKNSITHPNSTLKGCWVTIPRSSGLFCTTPHYTVWSGTLPRSAYVLLATSTNVYTFCDPIMSHCVNPYEAHSLPLSPGVQLRDPEATFRGMFLGSRWREPGDDYQNGGIPFLPGLCLG